MMTHGNDLEEPERTAGTWVASDRLRSIRAGPEASADRAGGRSSDRLLIDDCPAAAHGRLGQRLVEPANLEGTSRHAWPRAGVPHVPLYSGTRHRFATDAVRRGVSEHALQKFLGHSDPRSTRRLRTACGSGARAGAATTAPWGPLGDRRCSAS
jgi:hypothetical protein